jgi:hypothetical protein
MIFGKGFLTGAWSTPRNLFPWHYTYPALSVSAGLSLSGTPSLLLGLAFVALVRVANMSSDARGYIYVVVHARHPHRRGVTLIFHLTVSSISIHIPLHRLWLPMDTRPGTNQSGSGPYITIESEFSHRFPRAGWAYSCLRSLQSEFGNDLERLTDGLTAKDGSAVSGLSNDTWGITLELCHRHCGVDNDTKELHLHWPVSTSRLHHWERP